MLHSSCSSEQVCTGKQFLLLGIRRICWRRTILKFRKKIGAWKHCISLVQENFGSHRKLSLSSVGKSCVLTVCCSGSTGCTFFSRIRVRLCNIFLCWARRPWVPPCRILVSTIYFCRHFCLLLVSAQCTNLVQSFWRQIQWPVRSPSCATFPLQGDCAQRTPKAARVFASGLEKWDGCARREIILLVWENSAQYCPFVSGFSAFGCDSFVCSSQFRTENPEEIQNSWIRQIFAEWKSCSTFYFDRLLFCGKRNSSSFEVSCSLVSSPAEVVLSRTIFFCFSKAGLPCNALC